MFIENVCGKCRELSIHQKMINTKTIFPYLMRDQKSRDTSMDQILWNKLMPNGHHQLNDYLCQRLKLCKVQHIKKVELIIVRKLFKISMFPCMKLICNIFLYYSSVNQLDMTLCHFKICNMGRKRDTRYFQS